jgi:DUF971 family protein
VDPARIAVSKSRGVTIDWRDNHRSRYELKYLRERCPCAACAGPRPAQPEVASAFPIYPPALRIEGVEPVGNYALRIVWSDGHSTGIYSFEHLRRICPCSECAPASTAAGN